MSSLTGSAMPHVATPPWAEPCGSWPRGALGLAVFCPGLGFLMALLLLLKGSLP